MEPEAFRALVTRIQGGDQEAVGALLEAFEPEVRLVVRLKLPRLLRSQFDSMDFVQAVWQSVFSEWDQTPDCMDSPDHFMGYIAGIARNKVLQQYRRRTRTQKYDLRREQPLVARHPGEEFRVGEVAGHDPTPSQNVQAEDCWERVIAGCGSGLATRIMQMRRDGLTQEQIARELDVSDRAVRRVIESVRQRLLQREGV